MAAPGISMLGAVVADERIGERLLRLARSDPHEVVRHLDRHPDEADPVAWRAGAVASRLLGELDRSNEMLDAAERLARTGDARSGENAAVLVEITLTRAGNRFLAGDANGAVEVLDSVDVVDPDLRSQVEFQAATILARSGDVAKALPRLTEALAVLAEVGNDEVFAHASKNRGMLRLLMGDHVGARADIETAQQGFGELGLGLEVAYCLHDLGLVEARSGNIPAALDRFEAAEEAIRRLVDSDWEVKAGHCEVLLAAGLVGEAERLSAESAEGLRELGLHAERAEALAVRAEALGAAGRRRQAVESAGQAAELFREQGRHAYASEAELVRLRLTRDERAADGALLIARELRASGLLDAALSASIAAADLRIASDPARAVAELGALDVEVARSRFGVRLDHASARSAAKLAAGDRRGAAAAARAGSTLIESYQALIGHSDMRLTVQSSADRVQEVGLACAVAGRSVRRCFDWIERRAIGASVARQPEPVPDPELRSLLTELAGLPREDRSSRRRALEREIRTIARTRAPRVVPRRASFDEVAERLGDRTLAMFAGVGDRLVAVRVRRGRARRYDLGSMASAQALVADARRTLTRAAMSPSWDARDRIAERLGALDEMLLAPLGAHGRSLIVVAPAALADLPWSGLESRFGLPTVVTRSASSWVGAMSSGDGRRLETVVVAGPDLDHAAAEAAALAREIPTVSIVSAEEPIDSILGRLEGADVLHAVCHGDLRTDNPLFSSLRLHGGDLCAYHVQRVRVPPRVAVLSACSLALGADRAGTRLLGFTDALLGAGTSAVVASTLPVPDSSTTTRMMANLHRLFAEGIAPAEALCRAQHAVPSEQATLYAAAFSCFGSG